MERLTKREGKHTVRIGNEWRRHDVGWDKLAEYEDLEEKGLLPKFHLGDEFWGIHYDGVVKEKIVMLQQKKDGTWKYRFKNTCDFEENEFGKEFFDNEEDAEKRWRERYSKYA